MPKSIRIRCICTAARRVQSGREEVALLAMNPPDDAPLNEKFWSRAPEGSFHMSITNPAANGQFKEGKHYTLLLTEGF